MSSSFNDAKKRIILLDVRYKIYKQMALLIASINNNIIFKMFYHFYRLFLIKNR
jgi:hypothetical protein